MSDGAVTKEDQYKTVFITFKIDGEINKLLSESASRSGRGKTKECVMRLLDHLRAYRSIAEVRNYKNRTIKEG